MQYQGHSVITKCSTLACGDVSLSIKQVYSVLERCSRCLCAPLKGGGGGSLSGVMLVSRNPLKE